MGPGDAMTGEQATVLAAYVATGFLGSLLLWAGAQKLQRPYRAAIAIRQFRVSRRVHKRHGLALGATEVIIGLGLLSANASLFLVLSIPLLLLFTGVVISALGRGERFDCGCFGGRDRPISWLTALRNAVLLVAATLSLVAMLVLRAPSHADAVLGTAAGALVASTIALVHALVLARPFSFSLVRGSNG